MRPKIFVKLALTLMLALGGLEAVGDEKADAANLDELLRTFLANTEQKDTHEAFWSDDLIYTSSNGSRRSKAQILAGFDDRSNASTMTVNYGAEDVTIRVLGDTAVITFRLTGSENGVRIAEYLNTGVFRRGDDGWKAFTWQATKVPDPS